jgi:hypothetical protein
MKKLFYSDDGEQIVGYAEDVIKETKQYMIGRIDNEDWASTDSFDESIQLIEELKKYEPSDLVLVKYHPMGGYLVYKLEISQEEDND